MRLGCDWSFCIILYTANMQVYLNGFHGDTRPSSVLWLWSSVAEFWARGPCSFLKTLLILLWSWVLVREQDAFRIVAKAPCPGYKLDFCTVLTFMSFCFTFLWSMCSRLVPGYSAIVAYCCDMLWLFGRVPDFLLLTDLGWPSYISKIICHDVAGNSDSSLWSKKPLLTKLIPLPSPVACSSRAAKASGTSPFAKPHGRHGPLR